MEALLDVSTFFGLNFCAADIDPKAVLKILLAVSTAIGVTAGASLRGFAVLFFIYLLNSLDIIQMTTYGEWEETLLSWRWLGVLLFVAAILESLWESTPKLNFLDSAVGSAVLRPLSVILCSISSISLSSSILNLTAAIFIGIFLCGPIVVTRRALLKNSSAVNDNGYLKFDICFYETLAAILIAAFAFIMPLLSTALIIIAAVFFYYKIQNLSNLPKEFNLHMILAPYSPVVKTSERFAGKDSGSEVDIMFTDTISEKEQEEPKSFSSRFNNDGAPPPKTNSRRL